MANRQSKRLTAKGIENLTAPEAIKYTTRHADGDGLYLQIATGGTKTWVYIFRWQGKLKEMGLGSLRDVSLKDARIKAAAARQVVLEGRNPIIERKLGGEARALIPTFKDYADTYVASIESQWKNDKHKAQWKMTLDVYAAPLHARRIDEITTAHILDILTHQNLWTEKTETASRLRGRIEKVLDAAKTLGYRSGENPARWHAHLENLLPKKKKLTRGHFAAMPYRDMPAFVKELRSRKAETARALEFHILCASRPGMVEGMEQSEIDLKAALWTIPAHRMKLDRDHTVPLCARAVEILTEQLPKARNGVVFHSTRPGKTMSNNAMRTLLDRMGYGHFTPHGFRSTFRDWAGDETDHPKDVAEMALAHLVGDETEQAYRRATALGKRRLLMEDWASYLAGERPLRH